VQGVRTERDRLHRKLKDVQIHIHDEFTPVSHSISIQPEIERIKNGFEKLNLLEIATSPDVCRDARRP
jgi:hypothetical protein